ncbi:hypothetical protein M9H77_36656 [Catharanthus roseus]|uniref:Uncharacterized protein n=1 Tax=Catharanthus roseus TaxID=4058 RepID=A0ACB9ZV03_CATRO|nr:hypothetical protein M9H77_36656 [Catharanthus roseus]
MEEVPAHVHLGPIVPDVLSRQHEHRFGLIWSGDRETYYTDLQCRRFGRNLFQYCSTASRRWYWIDLIERLLGVRLSLIQFSGYKVKKEALEPWILRAFTGSETDDNIILRARGFIFLLIGGHMLPNFSGNLDHAVVHGGFGRYSGRTSCSSWCNMLCVMLKDNAHPLCVILTSHLLFSSFLALFKYNNSCTARPQLFSRTIIWLQGRQNSSSREPSSSKDNNSSPKLHFPLSIDNPFSAP